MKKRSKEILTLAAIGIFLALNANAKETKHVKDEEEDETSQTQSEEETPKTHSKKKIAPDDDAAEEDTDSEQETHHSRRRNSYDDESPQYSGHSPVHSLALLGTAALTATQTKISSTTANDSPPGFGGGLTLRGEISVAPNWTIGMDMDYGQKITSTLGFSYLTTRWLTFNPMVRYWPDKKIALGFGPYYGIPLGNVDAQYLDQTVSISHSDPLIGLKNDFGLSAAITGEFPLIRNALNLVAEGRYNFGLASLLPDKSAGGPVDSVTIRELQAALGLALVF